MARTAVLELEREVWLISTVGADHCCFAPRIVDSPPNNWSATDEATTVSSEGDRAGLELVAIVELSRSISVTGHDLCGSAYLVGSVGREVLEVDIDRLGQVTQLCQAGSSDPRYRSRRADGKDRDRAGGEQ